MANWSEAQYDAFVESRRQAWDAAGEGPGLEVPEKPKPIIPESPMNKTEAKFAEYLEQLKHMREIVGYVYEPMRLILSGNVKGKRNGVSYLPDFLIIHHDYFELVEIKAKRGKWTSMRDDSRAKINIAAEKFPWFKFTVAYLEKGEWTLEEV